MKLYFDGAIAFFADRDACSAGDLSITVPPNLSLSCNGKRCYTERGLARLPQSELKRGENKLFLRTENRLIPAESLLYDGEAVRPAGLPAEALLVRQHEALCALEGALEALSHRIAALERDAEGHKLFT